MGSSQIPTGVLLRRVGAPSLLAFCTVSWGIVQLCMAFVSTWGYLLLCRMLLGVLEVSHARIIRYAL